MELLEKENITVPHYVQPKFLSFIITVHDKEEKKDENANEHPAKRLDASTSETPQSKSDSKNDVAQMPSQNEEKQNGNLPNIMDVKSISKPQLPELKEVQSFGSVDLIPVSSTSVSELKVHEKPVKNFVEITPLPNKKTDKTHSNSESPCELVQLKEKQTKIQGMFLLSSSISSVQINK